MSVNRRSATSSIEVRGLAATFGSNRPLMLRALFAVGCSLGGALSPVAFAQTVEPPADSKSVAPVEQKADAPAPPATSPEASPAQAALPGSPEATAAAAVQAAPADAGALSSALGPSDDEAAFTLFRHDLVNLLILRADGRTLIAAAQIAAPDENDASRLAVKKTPGLIKRALKFGGQDPLVLWVASSNACLSPPGCADPAALKTLQTVDADNAAVWLRSFPEDDNAVRAQAIVARMAQAQRYDDYWGANVVALFHALEVLAVPASVTRQGIGVDAARINFATSIASALLPAQLRQLAGFCRAAAGKDPTLIGDCIAVARKLEIGGTFISQKIGFSIEEALVTSGVDRDVMLARERSAVWQQEKFLELSARFTREPAIAQSYIRLLGAEQNELAGNVAMLREQGLHSDPPAGWQPQGAAPASDPLLAQPTQR